MLCCGALSLVVRGDSVVLPFAGDEAVQNIMRWLDAGFHIGSLHMGFLEPCALLKKTL